MSTGLCQQETNYEVVVNQEGQYPLWPINKIVAKGWSMTGTRGSEESCLAFDEVWADMRPRSLQACTHSN